MPKLSQLKFELFLLSRLLDARHIGAHQTTYENAVKYVPTHVRGDAKDALDSLIRKGFLLTKPKHYGLHISINPQRVSEIRQLLT